MKNILKLSALLCVILTAAALFCGCTQQDGEAPMGFKEISNDGVSYNLYVPDEWISDISTGVTAAYYSNVDPSNVSVIAFDLTADTATNIEGYWATYEPSLKALFSNFEYVGEPDKIKLDGTDATAYTYTGTLTDVQYKVMQVVTIKDAQVYVFTYTATAEKYDTHFEDVWAILGYFDFT